MESSGLSWPVYVWAKCKLISKVAKSLYQKPVLISQLPLETTLQSRAELGK